MSDPGRGGGGCSPVHQKMAHIWHLNGLRVRAGALWFCVCVGCCSGWVKKVKHLPLHKPLACTPTPPPPPSAPPTSQVGMETFRVCRELVDGIVLVDNSAISAAIKVGGWKGSPGPPKRPHCTISVACATVWPGRRGPVASRPRGRRRAGCAAANTAMPPLPLGDMRATCQQACRPMRHAVCPPSHPAGRVQRDALHP